MTTEIDEMRHFTAAAEAFARIAKQWIERAIPAIRRMCEYFRAMAAHYMRWLPMLAEVRAFQVARRARMRRAYRGRRRAGAWR